MKLAELLASEDFALFFHHEFCEQAMRQYRDYAYPLGEPQFTIEREEGDTVSGRFLAQAEFEDGPHGATSGIFQLMLPDGLGAGNTTCLDNATLDVKIEAAPTLPGAL